MEGKIIPSWRYGPDEQAAIFDREEDVPDGWTDHPSKIASGTFDHDGDGKPGGSKPGRKVRPRGNGK